MSEELLKLVENYREKYTQWRELVEEERNVRQQLIDEHEGDGEPDNLRDLLDERVEEYGLRDKQKKALAETKEAERLLFSFNMDHCEDPYLKSELEHLAQDYAARITWLQQYLEPIESLKSDEED